MIEFKIGKLKWSFPLLNAIVNNPWKATKYILVFGTLKIMVINNIIIYLAGGTDYFPLFTRLGKFLYGLFS